MQEGMEYVSYEEAMGLFSCMEAVEWGLIEVYCHVCFIALGTRTEHSHLKQHCRRFGLYE